MHACRRCSITFLKPALGYQSGGATLVADCVMSRVHALMRACTRSACFNTNTQEHVLFMQSALGDITLTSYQRAIHPRHNHPMEHSGRFQ